MRETVLRPETQSGYRKRSRTAASAADAQINQVAPTLADVACIGWMGAEDDMTEEQTKALKTALRLAEDEADFHARHAADAKRDLAHHSEKLEGCQKTVAALKELCAAPNDPDKLRLASEDKR